MSETHTPEIRPATDEEIADYRTWNLNWMHHPKLAVSTVVSGLLARIESDRATIAALLETNSRLNRRVTKAEGVVLSKARHESAAGRNLGRALANAACSALRAQNAGLLAALEVALRYMPTWGLKPRQSDDLEQVEAAIQKAKESR